MLFSVLANCFYQVVHVKFQGIVLQLAERVQGFVPHQLAKGRFIQTRLECKRYRIEIT